METLLVLLVLLTIVNLAASFAIIKQNNERLAVSKEAIKELKVNLAGLAESLDNEESLRETVLTEIIEIKRMMIIRDLKIQQIDDRIKNTQASLITLTVAEKTPFINEPKKKPIKVVNGKPKKGAK